MGYDVIPLKFEGFDIGAKGNEEKMRSAAEHAYALSDRQLAKVDFFAYQRVLFVGKSIGTAAALRYRAVNKVEASTVLFTPIIQTFDSPADRCIALHGTADPWVDTDELTRICERESVPLYKYPKANHSLETGDVTTDLGYLREAIELLRGQMK